MGGGGGAKGGCGRTGRARTPAPSLYYRPGSSPGQPGETPPRALNKRPASSQPTRRAYSMKSKPSVLTLPLYYTKLIGRSSASQSWSDMGMSGMI